MYPLKTITLLVGMTALLAPVITEADHIFTPQCPTTEITWQQEKEGWIGTVPGWKSQLKFRGAQPPQEYNFAARVAPPDFFNPTVYCGYPNGVEGEISQLLPYASCHPIGEGRYLCEKK